jgi:regulator of cell morphogenesis and NO signaling
MTTAQSALRSIALAQPATIRVFERYHLDYCCGGSRALAQACSEKGIDTDEVLAAIEEATAAPKPAEDFTQATPIELIRHIVSRHHAYVKAELPRLLPMAAKVAAKHGPVHPEFTQVQRQLKALATELTEHLTKEELILFPYIEALDRFRNGDGDAPHACFNTVESPIRAMMNEHESAGALLDSMRAATKNFMAPEGACPTTVGLMDGLDAFERDLHRHVHLENNLLFPLAIDLEKKLAAERS